MTAYFVQVKVWGSVIITEVEYEKETAQSFTGVQKVRDLVGKSYYLPSRITKGENGFATLREALDRAVPPIARQLDTLRQIRSELNKLEQSLEAPRAN